jgi:hypothetical protein
MGALAFPPPYQTAIGKYLIVLVVSGACAVGAIVHRASDSDSAHATLVLIVGDPSLYGSSVRLL